MICRNCSRLIEPCPDHPADWVHTSTLLHICDINRMANDDTNRAEPDPAT